MKKSKIIIALLILFGFSQVSNAQESNLKFGVKGGVNFSNLSTDNAQDNKMLTGVNLGLFAKLPVTSSIAIQPEIYFTTKGSKLTYNNVFVDGTANFDLNYIEIPVLLVLNVTENFNIHVGPYASYLVSSKVKNASDVSFYNFEGNINSNDFNKFDTGIVAGVGIDLHSLSIGVRYNFGLIKVGKERDYNGTTYTFPDGKNSVISAYLSYSIL
jgi:hypothetical protein